MIINYLKIAWRNLVKDKLYSSINIFGLSAGLAACLLIGLYINNELQYDTFHEKGDQIARVTMEYSSAGTINEAAVAGTQVGPEFKRTFPKVTEYVRTYLGNNTIKYGNETFEEDRILYADEPFFDVFSFDFIKGDPKVALNAPDKIVMTQSMATKYFGSEEALGQVLRSGGKDLIVSGICADAPQNSQIKFDFVTQFFNLGNGVKRETWWSANWVTFLLTKTGTKIALLENQINEYMDSEAIVNQTGTTSPDYLHYHLEPLKSVHLHSSLAGFEPNGNIKYLYIFGLIALLILIIASANYTNLSTAQSMNRGSEIGMRKVMGASKSQIFSQFIGESILMTTLSTSLAIFFASALLPYFNQISLKSFVVSDILQPLPIGMLLLFSLGISLLAGFYPALILARTKVMSVLKSGFSFTGGRGQGLRKSLIVGQFAISIFLISLTSIIVNQVEFIKNTNLGYDREHVLVLPIGGNMFDNFENIKESLVTIQGVQSVTASYETPEFVEWTDGFSVVGDNGQQSVSISAMPIDLDFANTLGIEFAAGRDFVESDFALMDTANSKAEYQLPYIINETLAKKIGWTPDEAIGKIIDNRAPGPIVGVQKDFHFTSLHEPIGPLLQFLGRDFSRIFMVKIDDENIQKTIASIETVWNTRIPERPFSYHFLNDDFDKLYASEDRSTAILKSAAGLAVLLATLGLFGLAAFVTVQRTKEIGIRRVLGASLTSITVLFAGQFLKLVSISILVAIPLSFLAGNNWLENFTYRIDVSWWHFGLPGMMILGLTFLTVGYHALKVCWSNPVNALRSE